MAHKRKLDPGRIGDSRDSEAGDTPAKTMGGMWGGSAMNLLQRRIDETHGSLVQGILNGTIALSLSPDQIEDSIGSDRVTDWCSDDKFEALLANIERRGQRQPIRVRPSDPSWTPDSKEPLRTNSSFVVQSGRRRLEACRRLNRSVLAVLSTEKGNASLADLEERFHENTMRQELNAFEELLSIGLIAESLMDLAQAEIAERLGVSQNDISLGLSCIEYRDDILQQIDVTTTPKRAYRTIIPKLRSGKGSINDPNPAQHVKKEGHFVSDTLRIDVKENRNGLAFKVSGDELAKTDLDELAKKIASLFAG